MQKEWFWYVAFKKAFDAKGIRLHNVDAITCNGQVFSERMLAAAVGLKNNADLVALSPFLPALKERQLLG